jgi:hypothetical protein
VFEHTEDFVQAMLESTPPTMLMYGGSCLKDREINYEDAFLAQILFGSGGPNHGGNGKIDESNEACLRH